MPAPTRARAQIELPDKFKPIQDLLDGKVRMNSFVSIIGVVTDFRVPVMTRGPDWKCQISLYDHTTSEAHDENIELNIFWPQAHMPDASVGDVVMALHVKLQDMTGCPSLITNRGTDLWVYSGKKIPRPPVSSQTALKPQTRKTNRPKPEPSDHFFVSKFYHSIQKSKQPTETEFENRKLRSAMYAPGKKFKELRELSDHAFVDVIVEIVKEPWAQGDMCTLWVSDYTEHADFYNFAFQGIRGNPHGHNFSLDMVDDRGSTWVGPYGQRSLQVTCYEPHASFISDHQIQAGDWVHLRNLQIKFGRNGANLEGFLREDRDSRGTKVQVARIDLTADPSTIDARLKEALRRKRDYEKDKKAQMKALMNAANQGEKRRIEAAENQEPKAKANYKERRRQKRAHLQQNQGKPPQKPDEASPAVGSLNHRVKYEHQDRPVSSITEVLRAPPPLTTTVGGEEVELTLPFRNVNYRANVRIVNFSPSRLEEFTFAKEISDYDILGDHDSASDSDKESSSSDLEPLSQITHRWEWRFFLELEDATPENDSSKRRAAGGRKKTLWVAVDNSAAQCLVSADASNLADDADALETFRQRMFLLWGELEEHKARALEEQKRSASGNAPPADSDEEEGQQQGGFNNRPFGCCIREYGFKVPEEDPLKADAGEGRRWQRAFALFGTKITH